MNDLPILWSFRRCPYAIRARMAIASSGTRVRLREVLLRDKPAAFICQSPKATVPVLVTVDGAVVDESLDIMVWALEISDPDCLYTRQPVNRQDMIDLIARCEEEFKPNLDAYKYAKCGEMVDPLAARDRATVFLADLNTRLEAGGFLFGNSLTLADIALFPFVRQFAGVDPGWFKGFDLPHLLAWLERRVSSPLFANVMEKYRPWGEAGEEFLFPAPVGSSC